MMEIPGFQQNTPDALPVMSDNWLIGHSGGGRREPNMGAPATMMAMAVTIMSAARSGTGVGPRGHGWHQPVVGI